MLKRGDIWINFNLIYELNDEASSIEFTYLLICLLKKLKESKFEDGNWNGKFFLSTTDKMRETSATNTDRLTIWHS